MSEHEDPNADIRRCIVCGDVVGVYEPAVLELAGGATVRTSLLVAEGHDVRQTFHLGCAPPP